ncbi:MAG: dethiobiotin synthase [Gammaproteobacteria bacterium]|nr:dethiobiotin synthase [Gammaproteobacteria bacterium]MDH3411102.1 dethiobiotin synthase [Gammaproteobacteria bacterium]
MTIKSRQSEPRGVFVTGTDTGVGKTWVSLGLMASLQAQGFSVVGMKPVSAGCERTPEGLRNEDALLLQRQSSVMQPYERVNPAAFEPPIAPHIAAEEAGARINFARIRRAYDKLAVTADLCVVEGAGGWLVPLSARRSFADLVEHLGLPVMLVVAIRLGCLNHALLTVESIERRNLSLIGWVANLPAPETARAEQNIQALEKRITAPRIATVKYAPTTSVAHFAESLGTSKARRLLRRLAAA